MAKRNKKNKVQIPSITAQLPIPQINTNTEEFNEEEYFPKDWMELLYKKTQTVPDFSLYICDDSEDNIYYEIDKELAIFRSEFIPETDLNERVIEYKWEIRISKHFNIFDNTPEEHKDFRDRFKQELREASDLFKFLGRSDLFESAVDRFVLENI